MQVLMEMIRRMSPVGEVFLDICGACEELSLKFYDGLIEHFGEILELHRNFVIWSMSSLHHYLKNLESKRYIFNSPR